MRFTRITDYFHFKTSLKLVSLVWLVAAADFFFYREQTGWTLGLFAILLPFTGAVHNAKPLLTYRNVQMIFVAGLGLAAALINDPGALAQGMYAVTVFSLTLLMRNPFTDDIRYCLGNALLLFTLSIGQFCRDCVIFARIGRRIRKLHGESVPFLRRWLMPIVLSLIFIALFAEANPIISTWLSVVNWEIIAQYLSITRLFFWFFAAGLCWAIIRPGRTMRLSSGTPTFAAPSAMVGLLFNEHSIFTALILFNGLFLIQNLLDIAFLWSGAKLPSGMSYAEYAHQGAYPYGVLPRLLLFWLVTEAVQEKKRRIYLGKSLALFMRKLGLDPGRGGKRSDATRLKNQMDKLFRARISFERVADAGPDMMEEVWIDMPVGSETHYWWDVKNPNQDTIWESWVEVGEKFFEAITAYPVPADMRALRVLKNSAMALDLYVWATYRVHTANKKKAPQFIPWEGLMGQLGSEYSTVKDFKKKAWAALSKVHGVYPALKINKVTGGFVLHPGPTAVPLKAALT